MTAALRRVVVVGASLAGLRAAEALRSEGYDGAMEIVGAEPHLPYNRPPLSKELLAGTMRREEVHLQGTAELAAEWRLGVAATALDVTARTVALDDGSRVAFDGLVIATGSRARPLGSQIDGVFLLRTLDDSLHLRAALAEVDRVVVVGAGFIGCEVASTARALGCEVTMVDVGATPMEPRVGPLVGAWAARFHEMHGVRLVLGVGVEELEHDGRLRAVRLADGTRIEADVAVVGLGSVPNTGWLAGSGLPLGDGVACDGALAVQGVRGVVAAGDVASWPYEPAGVRLRVEHWSNAVEQGMWAARTLLHGAGVAGSFRTLPSFWSDQHGVRIQSIGLPGLGKESVLVEGSIDEDCFTVLYARDGRVVGALTVGMPPKRLARLRGAVSRAEPLDDVAAHAAA
jgi:3-phenylpropionate/trans-cinnamate dioxygenase ferredoxin reductase subunit